MAYAPTRPCLEPGCPHRAEVRGRCVLHARQRREYEDRRRGGANERGYDYRWQRIVADAIAAQPWCSLCMAEHDLTGDHIVPLSKGGVSTPNNCRVLCRGCNSRKGEKA